MHKEEKCWIYYIFCIIYHTLILMLIVFSQSTTGFTYPLNSCLLLFEFFNSIGVSGSFSMLVCSVSFAHGWTSADPMRK